MSCAHINALPTLGTLDRPVCVVIVDDANG
jgi:hypothetical protein